MSDEIKPCPFCGKSDFEATLDGLYCTHCEADVGDDWNTRPIEDALRKELDNFKAQNSRLLSEIDDLKRRSSLCGDNGIRDGAQYLYEHPEYDMLQAEGDSPAGQITVIFLRGKQDHATPLKNAKSDNADLRRQLEEAKAIVDLARELRKVDGAGGIFSAIKCAEAGEKLDAALKGSESK